MTGRYSSEQLKKIAMGTMFVDHAAVAIVYGCGLNEVSPWIGNIGLAMRLIGRMAFPLYAFLLVQGFLWTRDWLRYAGRVAIFALVSEIPYDLVAFDLAWSSVRQNTMFTMLIGLVCMRGIQWALESDWCSGEGMEFPRRAMAAMIAVMGMLTAELFRVDYGAYGVLIILIFYILRYRPIEQLVTGCVCLFLMYRNEFAYASWIAFFFISNYNGKRGKKMGYMPYVFYPAHLLALWMAGAVMRL